MSSIVIYILISFHRGLHKSKTVLQIQVVLSSSNHRLSGIEFDDLDFKKAGYQPFTAYGQSKTANIYMATEIDRRYGSKGAVSHDNTIHKLCHLMLQLRASTPLAVIACNVVFSMRGHSARKRTELRKILLDSPSCALSTQAQAFFGRTL